MKKLLLLSFLLLTGYQLQAAESHAAQAVDSAHKTVTFKLADKTIITVPLTFTYWLSTVKNMLEDLGEESDEPINFELNRFITEETLTFLQDLATQAITEQDVVEYLQRLTLVQLIYLCNANGFLDLNKTFTNDHNQRNLDVILLEEIAKRLRESRFIDPYIFKLIPTNSDLDTGLIEEIYKKAPSERIHTYLEGHTAAIYDIEFSPDGRFMASTSIRDNTVRIWNVQTGACVSTINAIDQIESKKFSHDWQMLAIAQTSDVTIWNPLTGQLLHTLRREHGNGDLRGITQLTFSPHGQLLAVATEAGGLTLWSPLTGTRLHTLSDSDGESFILSATFSPDSLLLTSCSTDGVSRIWDVQTGTCVQTLQYQNPLYLDGSEESQDGRLIASLEANRSTLNIVEKSTGIILHTLQMHNNEFNSIEFSPHGQLLASTSRLDNTVRIWDVQTGTCVHTFQGHIDRIGSIEFSPNSQLLASTSRDGEARIWDLQTGTCVHAFLMPDIMVMKFSPDNKFLAIMIRNSPTLVLYCNAFTKAGVNLPYAQHFPIEDVLYVYHNSEKSYSMNKIDEEAKRKKRTLSQINEEGDEVASEHQAKKTKLK